jgi:branched-chain amino acid transport system ATP-binding protein
MENRHEPLLRVEQLTIFRSGDPVLTDVSFSLDGGGQILGVFGPNGAGKSTLLQCLAGALKPAHGSLMLSGMQLARHQPDARVKHGIVFVPQSNVVFPHLTVRENLLIASSGGISQRDAHEAWDYIFELFPWLSSRMDERAQVLSGGERQMLALARAFLFRPRLLILDEPTLGLSLRVRTQVLTTLRAFARTREVSIILAEQQVSEAVQICDRYLALREGKVVIDAPVGTAEEVIATLARLFRPSPLSGRSTMSSPDPNVHSAGSAESEETKPPPGSTYFLLLAGGALSLMALAAFMIYHIGSSWAERGQIGDMFGLTNSLFSGLALAGVVYALMLQIHEIRIQKSDLALNREALRRTAEVQTQQFVASFTRGTIEATQRLERIQDGADAFESRWKEGKRPKDDQQVQDFYNGFRNFMREQFASIAYVIGLDSPLLAPFLEFHEVLSAAERANSYTAYEEYRREYPSIGATVQELRSRVFTLLPERLAALGAPSVGSTEGGEG